jgi:hypothetical protein
VHDCLPCCGHGLSSILSVHNPEGIFFPKGPFIMKNQLLLIALLTVGLIPGSVLAGNPNGCATIQQGGLLRSDGVEIEPGYDEWGYNHQARLFNGLYCEAYQNASWCTAYADVDLSMKWNDAWKSNMDCDGDHYLDRHYGYPSYIGSGAWLTNLQSGEYDQEGRICNWEYFVKIVAAPADAQVVGLTWFTSDGDEIGPVIWNEFAIIEEVYNDPCGGAHGVSYHSPVGPGFGQY